MNRIQLIGRLGRDPEGGQSGNGSYACFSLSTNEFWTDRCSGEAVQHTEWHQVVCYDRLAAIALAFLTKGSEVYVEGRQRTSRWMDSDSRERHAAEVRIDELKMLRRAPKADAIVGAAKGMASIEQLMKDAAAGFRTDVSMADLASMLAVVRTSLVADGDVEMEKGDPATHRAPDFHRESP